MGYGLLPHIPSRVADILADAGYQVVIFECHEDALSALRDRAPHGIIGEMAYGMEGLCFLEKVREVDRDVPVILTTCEPVVNVLVQAMKCGVFDILLPPMKKNNVLSAIERATGLGSRDGERKQYREGFECALQRDSHEPGEELNRESSLETIYVMTKASEYRDYTTGEHIRRIGLYSEKIAREMGESEEFCGDILLAGQMHDVGKIGIPDSILLKQGPLSENEFTTMKQHTRIGARMFQDCKSRMLEMAGEIALCHHERWDGTGYPRGLKEDEIPLSARIVALADHYDALRSNRPYRRGFSHEDAFRIITEGDGRIMPQDFDPEVLSVFRKFQKDFEMIFRFNNDECRKIPDEAETTNAPLG